MTVTYKCSKCGREGHKLWRQVHTFADQIRLLCRVCGTEDQLKQIDSYERSSLIHSRTSCLGDLVPARPVDGTFWGHTSGPQESVDWWRALPG